MNMCYWNFKKLAEITEARISYLSPKTINKSGRKLLKIFVEFSTHLPNIFDRLFSLSEIVLNKIFCQF